MSTLITSSVLPNMMGIPSKIVAPLKEKYLRYRSPQVPITMVTANWLMLPNMVNEMARNLWGGSTKRIRPPYSPILLGVSIVMLQPAITDLNALTKVNFWSGRNNSCHLRDSIP